MPSRQKSIPPPLAELDPETFERHARKVLSEAVATMWPMARKLEKLHHTLADLSNECARREPNRDVREGRVPWSFLWKAAVAANREVEAPISVLLDDIQRLERAAKITDEEMRADFEATQKRRAVARG